MRFLKWTGGVLLFLLVIVLMGPRPAAPVIDLKPIIINTDVSLASLVHKIRSEEDTVKNIRPGNEAQVIWADTTPSKTPYAIVYLHGFSASHAEAYPVHQNVARRFGCNLYLSRLQAHGLSEKEPLLRLTPEELIKSAKEAIAIGKQLGDSVILMSTSTGGTLSLMLAGEDSLIAGLILYSPNIDLYDQKSFLLTQPWGLQLARVVIGDRYYRFDAPPTAQHYWNTTYRIEALIALKSLMNATMNVTTFKKVNQPVFMGYYYKDETHQDDVVSIPRMLDMYNELGTPDALKRKVAFPDAGYHVIGSSYWSTHTAEVEEQTNRFLEEIMHLKPKTL
jgi:pimeloyl-ACP methyl ester carboxylesterase